MEKTVTLTMSQEIAEALAEALFFAGDIEDHTFCYILSGLIRTGAKLPDVEATKDLKAYIEDRRARYLEHHPDMEENPLDDLAKLL